MKRVTLPLKSHSNTLSYALQQRALEDWIPQIKNCRPKVQQSPTGGADLVLKPKAVDLPNLLLNLKMVGVPHGMK